MIFLFLPQGKKAPEWIGRFGLVPIDSAQEIIVNRFFNCEFPSKDFASSSKCYTRVNMSQDIEVLYQLSI
jgi:hypothetical protein